MAGKITQTIERVIAAAVREPGARYSLTLPAVQPCSVGQTPQHQIETITKHEIETITKHEIETITKHAETTL